MTDHRTPAGRARRSWRRGGTLLAVGALVLAAACAGDDPAAEAGRTGGGDPTLVVQVRNPLMEADLATLSQASDLVVHGTVEAVETGVRIDGTELAYSVFTVAVGEVLAGEAGGTVQVAAATESRGRDIEVEGRPPLPEEGDDAVWFLNELAPEFGREGYVLSSPTGLLAMDGGSVATPEHTHGGEAPPAISEAEELGSEGEVLDHLRSVAG